MDTYTATATLAGDLPPWSVFNGLEPEDVVTALSIVLDIALSKTGDKPTEGAQIEKDLQRAYALLGADYPEYGEPFPDIMVMTSWMAWDAKVHPIQRYANGERVKEAK